MSLVLYCMVQLVQVLQNFAMEVFKYLKYKQNNLT